jgi:hypothetical protein
MRTPHFFLNLILLRGRAGLATLAAHRARDHVPLTDQPDHTAISEVVHYSPCAEVDHDHHCQEYRVGP